MSDEELLPIDDGVPIPGKQFGCRTPLTRTMHALEVGQSFLLKTEAEYTAYRWATKRYLPRRFKVRTVGRDLWRVWRIE